MLQIYQSVASGPQTWHGTWTPSGHRLRLRTWRNVKMRLSERSEESACIYTAINMRSIHFTSLPAAMIPFTMTRPWSVAAGPERQWWPDARSRSRFQGMDHRRWFGTRNPTIMEPALLLNVYSFEDLLTGLSLSNIQSAFTLHIGR